MRRRPIVVAPRRGPSLVGTMARTAVIAGTATAVAGATSNAMHSSAANKAAAQQAQIDAGVQQALAEQAAADQAAAAQQAQFDAAVQQAAAQQVAAQQAAVQEAAAQPAAAPASSDTISQLKDLADLKAAGILTDAEFEAQKAKILAGG